jgi:hypothetical protein
MRHTTSHNRCHADHAHDTRYKCGTSSPDVAGAIGLRGRRSAVPSRSLSLSVDVCCSSLRGIDGVDFSRRAPAHDSSGGDNETTKRRSITPPRRQETAQRRHYTTHKLRTQRGTLARAHTRTHARHVTCERSERHLRAHCLGHARSLRCAAVGCAARQLRSSVARRAALQLAAAAEGASDDAAGRTRQHTRQSQHHDERRCVQWVQAACDARIDDNNRQRE